MCTPQQLLALREHEAPVNQEHLSLAKQAWQAFRCANPEDWQALLEADIAALPFLAGAIYRQLQEYPGHRTGLPLTAQTALKIIADGEQRPARVFALYQQQEARRFMGDASFWVILREMIESDPPLLALPKGQQLTLSSSPEQTLRLTEEGIAVLSAQCNWLDRNPIDRWIGGVHLTDCKSITHYGL